MRNETTRIHVLAEELLDDYAACPVPEGKRISGLSQGLVWSGIGFCMAMFSLGGTLAASMGLASFLHSTLLGAVIITIIACLIGTIGARTHLPSAFLARFTLGTVGGKLFGLVLAVSMFGWYSYQCYYFADTLVSALRDFGLPGGPIPFWAIAGGLLMMVTALVGFNGITLLSTLGVPLLFALSLAAVSVLHSQAGVSMQQAILSPGDGSIGLPGGVVMVVGSFITGACNVPDLSRFSRRPRDAVMGCVLGMLIAFPASLLLGGFFYLSCGTSDPCRIFLEFCDMGIFVPFLVVISTWTTNGFNLYCSSLDIRNALPDQVRLPRWLITLVTGIVSALLGALGVMENFTAFLNLLGVLIPPVASVIIADYYLYNRGNGQYDYKKAGSLPSFRRTTCLSAMVGIAVGLLCNYNVLPGLHTLCAVIPACLVSMLASTAALVLLNAVAHAGTARAGACE